MLTFKCSYDGIKADIWAAGVTLYYMVFGVYPFYSSNFIEVFELIKNQELEFEKQLKATDRWKNDEDLKELLKGMLDKNVESRLTLEKILSHKWLSS